MTFVTDIARVPPVPLGSRLRISREWRGYDQKDMAGVLGVTRQTVSNYERGATPMSKLALNAWAAHCDVDVDWLRTGEIVAGGGPGTEAQTTDYGSVVLDRPVADLDAEREARRGAERPMRHAMGE